MHCIRTQVLTQPYQLKELQQAIFQPIQHINKTGNKNKSNTKSNNRTAKHSIKRTLGLHKSKLYQKSKRLLQVLSIAALILPTKSLTHTTQMSAFDKVLSKGDFNVAIITSDSTLFSHGEYQHGFGYDVTRDYANHLGADLRLHRFDNKEQALLALNQGSVDAILSDDSIGDDALEFADVSCGLPIANQGLNGNTRLNFNKGDGFARHAKSYLCNVDTMSHTWHLAKFYDQNILDDYSEWRFGKIMSERLPELKNTFKTQANKHNHDWQLLAVISYQESQLNPDAVSPTGVRGIMMLTNDTAAAMGVADRTNPIQSIQGGAKYLEILNGEFDYIQEQDRLWFVLAAYNMGPNAVKRIQSELGAQGKDPNSWGDFYSYLSANVAKNSRYGQCMHYVKNIRTYLENLQHLDKVNA